ncbi:hypothetical protein PYCC9005_004600 [Savitreella phatthalungensis]
MSTKKLSQSPIKKPDSPHAAMGVGERTAKGSPAPGQGKAPPAEIGEPSEPSAMSPEEKRQLQADDPTLSGPKPKPKL